MHESINLYDLKRAMRASVLGANGRDPVVPEPAPRGPRLAEPRRHLSAALHSLATAIFSRPAADPPTGLQG